MRDFRKLKSFALAVIGAYTIVAIPQSKPPDCYSNLQLPNGAKDANGKTIINISILTVPNYGWPDSSGSGNADSTIQNDINCAIGLWTAQGGSNGQGIPYSFNITAPNTGSADVIVNRDSTPGSPVAVTTHPQTGTVNNVQQFGQPATLTINPNAPSIDTTLCATIAHELGHVMGLADAASGTIMGRVVGTPNANGTVSSWTNATQKVQKGDVNNVQFAAANQSQCKDIAKAQDTENDQNQCAGDPPNDSCYCDGTSLTYQCACDGNPTTCSDGTSAVCDNNEWECASVTTAQCDGNPPCDGAVCNGDDSWDTSECGTVSTSQCDGDPPCATAVCASDNTWDTSSCSCDDSCDPSCSAYDPCECDPDSCGGSGGGNFCKEGDPCTGGEDCDGDPDDPCGGSDDDGLNRSPFDKPVLVSTALSFVAVFPFMFTRKRRDGE